MITRRDKARQQNITEIKALAREQMLTKGATSISLRKIARDMGMTAPALYRYFANFDALITALVIDAFSGAGNAMAEAKASKDPVDFGGQFLAITEGYKTWAVTNPADFSLIAGTPIPDYHAPAEETEPFAQQAWQPFMSLIIVARMEGKLILPALDENRPLPHSEKFLETWFSFDVPIDIPLLHTVIITQATVQGLLQAHIYNRFPEVALEAYSLEMSRLRERIGLPSPHANPL